MKHCNLHNKSESKEKTTNDSDNDAIINIKLCNCQKPAHRLLFNQELFLDYVRCRAVGMKCYLTKYEMFNCMMQNTHYRHCRNEI